MTPMIDAPPDAVAGIAARTEAHLRTILGAEITRWTARDPRLGEAVRLLESMVLSKGKRLRAAFCYWSWVGTCRWLGARDRDEGDILDACAAFELLQAFALIHDDIMDDAATRRGLPTIHTTQAERLRRSGWRGEPRRYGEGVAILLGDLAHAYADRCIGNTTPATRALWDELRIELNLGQYLDLRSSAAGDGDQPTARSVAMFKSALYTIVRPLQLGATLAPGWMAMSPEGREVALDRIEAFGRPLGQAFQLRDDLLGVLGDGSRIGKPVGGDLREGKATELVALAARRATPAQASILAHIGNPQLTAAQIATIVEVLHATGAVGLIERRINELVDDAHGKLGNLRMDPETQVTMAALADYVGRRTH